MIWCNIILFKNNSNKYQQNNRYKILFKIINKLNNKYQTIC